MTNFPPEVVEKVATAVRHIEYHNDNYDTPQLLGDDLTRESAEAIAHWHLSELRRIVGPLVEALEKIEEAHPVCSVPDEHVQHVWSICEEALASPALKEMGLTNTKEDSK